MPPPTLLPLVVVIGSTGTGKSDLAVEIATRHDGEIINADAMQMYSGLPILTNKHPVSERRGIPHHLLDQIPLDAPPWVVGDFCREARRLAGEIRARGKLPIVVGGTTYYVLSLLDRDASVLDGGDPDDKPDANGGKEPGAEQRRDLPELDAPTDVLYARLCETDPEMAGKWHPHDRRKIQRSLEIFLRTGRRASSIYGAQRERKPAPPAQAPTPEIGTPLLFWVYTAPDVLKARLDRRVHAMLAEGLPDELRSMREAKNRWEREGARVDTSRGIWQSIGIKHLDAYMDAVEGGRATANELEKLKDAGVAEMQAATRQYARYQVRFIRKRFGSAFLPRGLEPGPEHADQRTDPRHHPRLFVLDTTDAAAWRKDVADPACEIAASFLCGGPLPSPPSISEVARTVLADMASAVTERASEKLSRRECRVCGVTCTTESMWTRHVRGRSHKSATRRAGKRALVPVENADRNMALVAIDASLETSRVGVERAEAESSPELASLEFMQYEG